MDLTGLLSMLAQSLHIVGALDDRLRSPPE